MFVPLHSKNKQKQYNNEKANFEPYFLGSGCHLFVHAGMRAVVECRLWMAVAGDGGCVLLCAMLWRVCAGG